MRAIGLVINDWQLSGIFRADSGAQYDIGYSYNSGRRVNLDRLARLQRAHRHQRPRSDWVGLLEQSVPAVQEHDGAWRWRVAGTTAALSGPQVGSTGLESGRNLLTGCKDTAVDLAIQRTIRIGGNRQLQLRADVFNAFNTVVYNGRANDSVQQRHRHDGAQLAVPRGRHDRPGWTQPNPAGFGAATSALALRSVQLVIKFNF